MMGDAPDDYELSNREELAPLVRDFHELIGGRDLTDDELLALDFALEWTFAWAEDEYESKLVEIASKWDVEYAVSYGMMPNVRIMNMPSLAVAKKVAAALGGQVRFRSTSKWDLYKEAE